MLNVDQAEVVRKITTLYTENKSSTYRINNEREWQKCQELYLSILPPKTFPWPDCSNVDLGIVEMTVDNIKSRYIMSTISEKPFFNTIPRTPVGEDNQKIVEDLMSFVLDQHIDIGEVLEKLTHNLAKFGTTFTKRYWKKEFRNINKMSYDPATGLQTQPDTQVNETGQVDVIDLQHLFFPEDATSDIQNCHYIFHRIFLSPTELKKRVQTHSYDVNGVEKCLTNFRSYLESRQKTAEQTVLPSVQQGLSSQGIGQGIPSKLSQDKIEILECYIQYDGDGDGLDEECIFTIAPEAQVYLRGELLKDIFFDGLRPFNRFVYKDVGLLYGRGIPKMLESYRSAMNTTYNQGVDCAMIQILPWFFYRYASSFRPEEVKLCPGKGIPVDDVNEVRIPTFPASAGLAFNIINSLMSFVERQTGLSAPQVGEVSGERTTAYEINTVVSEGNIKHQDRIINFHQELGVLLEGIYHLYRQMLPINFQMRIPNPQPVQPQVPGQPPMVQPSMTQQNFVQQPVDRKDLLEEYDFVILGSLTMGNRSAKKQDSVALYNLLMANPYVNQNPRAVYELLRDILSNFDKRNPDKFLPPEHAIEVLYNQSLQRIMGGGGAGQPPPQPRPGGSTPTRPPTPQAPPTPGVR